MTISWRRIWRKFDAELDRRMDVECPKGGRHEWGIEINIDAVKMFSHQTTGDVHGYCTRCGKTIGGTSVLALANAAMHLTADEAEAAESSMGTENYNRTAAQALDTYAAAWRET